jgi:hypothetical protein
MGRATRSIVSNFVWMSLHFEVSDIVPVSSPDIRSCLVHWARNGSRRTIIDSTTGTCVIFTYPDASQPGPLPSWSVSCQSSEPESKLTALSPMSNRTDHGVTSTLETVTLATFPGKVHSLNQLPYPSRALARFPLAGKYASRSINYKLISLPQSPDRKSDPYSFLRSATSCFIDIIAKDCRSVLYDFVIPPYPHC